MFLRLLLIQCLKSNCQKVKTTRSKSLKNFIKPLKKIINIIQAYLAKKMTYCESHGASSSRNFSFLRWNNLLTAEYMNCVIRVTLSQSNGNCKPPKAEELYAVGSNDELGS